MSVSRRSILGVLAATPMLARATPALASMNLDHVSTAVAKPAVFFVPHQDDELLIMGPAIRNHVRAGREVHVILFGRGDGTVVRTRDMPRLLGYTPTGEEIGRVRDREFKNSLYRLGVSKFRHIPPYTTRMAEKAFTVAGATDIMRAYVSRLPGADCKTVSPTDPNPDHANLGIALRNMQKNKELPHPVRFYVAPWARNAPGLPATLGRERCGLPADYDKPYKYENVATDDWGVGYKSTRKYFDYLSTDHSSYWHA